MMYWDKAGPAVYVDSKYSLADIKLGGNNTFAPWVNLYGCTLGKDTKIGAFVEIQKGVVIGDRCKISSHTFICEGVVIEKEVFVGHGVCFINDKHPKAVNANGSMKGQDDWDLMKTLVCRGASIGSNATIMGGLRIGVNSVIGAGATVLRSVADNETVYGIVS